MRGQVHTLEGTIAAILVLTSVLFATQITTVTPLTASTANQHIENQERKAAVGSLQVAASQGALRPAVLTLRRTNAGPRPVNTSENLASYVAGSTGLALDDILGHGFGNVSIAYNVNARYVRSDGTLSNPVRILHSGVPTENAVSVTRVVTLYDDDPLHDRSGSANATTVGSADPLRSDAPGPVYNVVVVEVTVWRM